MRKNKLKERIFTFCLGIFLICISMYAYNKTHIRQKVLKEGILRSAIVSKTTTRGTNKSIYIKINDKQLSAGEAFGHYNRTIQGDSIKVYYLEGSEYVVLEGKKSFINTIVFEYIIALIGLCLIIVSFFYKEKIKYLRQPRVISLKTNVNKNNLQEILDSFLPSNDVLYKLDKEDISSIKRNIKVLFEIKPQLLLNHIAKLLSAEDDKAGTIYDAIIEYKCLTNSQFIEELKKIMTFYNENHTTNCLDVIKVFLISEQAENIELQEKIKGLINEISFTKPVIKNELFALLQ
jgi:hypothetical protein